MVDSWEMPEISGKNSRKFGEKYAVVFRTGKENFKKYTKMAQKLFSYTVIHRCKSDTACHLNCMADVILIGFHLEPNAYRYDSLISSYV